MCSAWMNVGTVLLDWLSNWGSFDFHSGDKKTQNKTTTTTTTTATTTTTTTTTINKVRLLTESVYVTRKNKC